MKIQIKSLVQNGLLNRNRTLITDAIKSFEGKEILITFEKPKNKRSNNQNAYYWSCLIPLMQLGAKEIWGEVWNIDKSHKFLSNKFVFYESINKNTGEITNTHKSTTELTTTDWEIYMIQIRIYLLEDFNIDAPMPNENLTLEL